MLKKLILLLIAFCFLTSTAFAWEESFEGHSKDAPLTDFTMVSNSNIASYEHGTAIIYQNNPGSGSFNASVPFNGYLGYSVYLSTYSGYQFTVTGYDSLNRIVIAPDAGITVNTNGWHRIELIENTAGTGVNIYVDSVLKWSKTYSYSSDVVKFKIINYHSNNALVVCDDFSTSAGIISCDSLCQVSDLGQYYRVGCEYGALSGNSTFYAKIYTPSGVSLKQDLTNLSEQLVPISFMTEPGTYLIKLYQVSAGSAFPIASRFFDFDVSNSDKITTDKTEYKPGETILINTFAKNYAGYWVEVPYYDSSGKLQVFKYDVKADDYTYKFTLPQTARGGSFIIGLYNPDGVLKDGTQFDCLASGGITSLLLDKGVYAPLDTVKISYSNMPASTHIVLKLNQGDTLLTTNDFGTLTGSGILTYKITSTTADNIIVYAYSGNTQLGQETAVIKSGVYYLSGHIVDPIDGSLIPGASIQIGTSSALSDDNGAYNFTVPAGWQNLSVTKTGYMPNLNKVNIVYATASQDFYLVPNYTNAGHSIYGIVTDYYTGAPVTNAYIQLKQGSITHSLFSYSGSGYYLYDGSDLTGSWVVTVTKDGYYTTTQTVTISGDTYKQILLTPLKYSSTGDSGSSDNSGGSSSGGSSSGGSSSGGSSSGGSDTGVSSDRPGREAAKSTMEEFESIVPSMFGLVIFKVVMELVR